MACYLVDLKAVAAPLLRPLPVSHIGKHLIFFLGC